MSNQFFVILPSNTPGFQDNAPNKFRVHLPKTIDFDGSWYCVLHSIIYTHSWQNVGTTDEQWIEVKLKNGNRIRTFIPKFSYSTADQLESTLIDYIHKGLELSLKEREIRDQFINESISRVKRSTPNPLLNVIQTTQNQEKDNFLKALSERLKPTEDDVILTDKEKDEKHLETAKRVASLKIQEAERGIEKINQVHDEIKEMIKKVHNTEFSPNEELDKIKYKILKHATKNDILWNAAAIDLERCRANLLIVNEVYDRKDVKRAKQMTDEIKMLRKKIAGDENDQNYKTYYLKFIQNLKDIVFREYHEEFLPKLSSLSTVQESSSKNITTEIITDNENFKANENVKIQDSQIPSREINIESENARQKTTQIEEPPKSDKENKIISKSEISNVSENSSIQDSQRPHQVITVESDNISQKHAQTPIAEKLVAKGVGQSIRELITNIREGTTYERGDVIYLPHDYLDKDIRKFIKAVRLRYNPTSQKFKFAVFDDDQEVESIALSPQINYILGFENDVNIKPYAEAKYSYNLQGGLNNFCVYAHSLTENIIVGNQLVSLLRVVSVSGNHGDVIEKIYEAPVYSKVLPKQINEIEIELRTMDGHLIPFQFGNTVVTIVFKKMINF
jgi:hypothetical protein